MMAKGNLDFWNIVVIIVHWNRPDECLQTVQNLRQQGVPCGITVIDNGSDPEKKSQLEALLPKDIGLVKLSENLGWGAALNVAVQDWLDTQQGQYICVSAHDALLHHGCLEKLIGAMDADKTLGMASPEYGIANIPRYSPMKGARLEKIPPRTAEAAEYADFIHGTFAIFRRECFASIGIFDPIYFAYGDETEIGIRANRHGWKCAVVWGAVVVNPGSWTAKPLLTYLWTRNSLFMARKYGGLLAAYLRMLLIILNSIRLGLSGKLDRNNLNAKLMASMDFTLGRTGKPIPSRWRALVAHSSS